jgi:2-dehydropantoate 2-reductase
VHVAVFGAGAIGCWLGGKLAAAGTRVTLIGRRRVMDELAGGLRVGELDGTIVEAKPELATDAAAARDADLVLVTVKSPATAEAGRELAGVIDAHATVVSVQNGVRNPRTLRDALPPERVLAGMIEFNVVRPAPGTYQRTTSGRLMIERAPASRSVEAFAAACNAAGLPCELRDDMPAVQWAKLVLNLNNAINALSNVPLVEELANRDFRRCFAAAQREALDVLAAADQPVAKLSPVPPAWLPRILGSPDWLFQAIAKRFVSVDPRARSSMWDDFEAKRPTEVDYLQGEIVALAARHGRAAPVNTAIAALVHAAEAGGRRDFTGRELLQLLR